MYDSADCCMDMTSVRIGGLDRTGVTVTTASVEKETGTERG